MTTRTNKLRCGNFTSSKIFKLVGAPVPRRTYINECNMERKLQRTLSNDVSAKSTTWGTLCEKRVFDLLGTEYELTSQETIKHPEIDCWSGSPDGIKKEAVYDIKCPYTLKSFCELVEIIETRDCRVLKKENPEYYWQLVSNGILTNKEYAELIIYAPFQSELNAIRLLAEDAQPADLYRFYWIAKSTDEELPYLLNDGFYKNLNILSFKIPENDKDLLINTVKMNALELLPIPQIA